MANRIRPILKRVIAPTQAAFVLGRWIHENGLLAQELVATVKRNQHHGGLMGIKLDMSKAYDRVEWPFVLRILTLLGFPEKFVGWIS